MSTRTVAAVRNEMVEIARGRASNGYLRIYAARRSDMLAELRLGTFSEPKNGQIKADEIMPDMAAKSSGKATTYKVFEADGDTLVWDGDVVLRKKGAPSDNLELDSTDIHAGAEVSITSLVYSIP